MNAEIITIGDEILIGQVVDTNSAYLASELNKLGITIVHIASVSDSSNAIGHALDAAASRADIIFITGGLGPTNDDITKQTLVKYFGSKLIQVPEVLDRINALLSSRGVVINELNRKQAELPDNSEILRNTTGTAQGMWFRKNNKDFIALPGVPYEMESIFHEEIEYRIRQRFSLPSIFHLTVLVQGIPESELAIRIKDWETNLPSGIRLAYLPSPGLMRLRLTGKSDESVGSLQMQMQCEVDKLNQLIGDYIFGTNEDKLEVLIGNLLTQNRATLSIAESCTGGYISSNITSVPGSSVYFKGAIVAYSNDIKIKELSVKANDIAKYGAVSESVAIQMASGIRKRLNTNYSLAVTGIAGPSGGSSDKPVGTTWIAISSERGTYGRLFLFGEDRGRNIQKATLTALFMLWKEIRMGI